MKLTAFASKAKERETGHAVSSAKDRETRNAGSCRKGYGNRVCRFVWQRIGNTVCGMGGALLGAWRTDDGGHVVKGSYVLTRPLEARSSST